MGVDSNVLIFERIKEELATAKGRASGGRRRLRPRLPDHPRHPRRLADRGRVPLPVRHRSDSRLRHDAGHRTAVERVHGRLRVADAVRVRAVAAHRRSAASERFRIRHAAFSTTRTSTSSSGAGTPSRCRRLVILAGAADGRRAGHAARHRLLGRHVVVVQVPAAGRRGGGAQGARRVPGEKVVQQYGDADAARCWCGCRSAGTGEGINLEQGARGDERRGDQGRTSASSRSSAARWSARSIGKDLQRKGIYATLLVDRRHHRLHRAAVPLDVRDRRHRRDASTTSWSRWRCWCSSATTCR